MKRWVTATNGLKLRRGPGGDADYGAHIGLLGSGTAVTILGTALEEPWVFVQEEGGDLGWVSSEYLTDIAPATPARGYRVAGSLEKLTQQVDQKWPSRKKGADGDIGDAAHQARASDHNPDENRVVKAKDLTHDPATGIDGEKLVRSLVGSRDPRISYIIFNRRIWRSYPRPSRNGRPAVAAWQPQPYTGENPHTGHVHISVVADPRQYDRADPWALPA